MRKFTLSLATTALAALLGLAACPKEQVGGSASSTSATAGASSSTGERTPTSTGGEVPTTGTPDPTTGTTTGTTGTSSGSETGSSTGALLSTGTSIGGESSSSSGDATTGPPPQLFDCFGCDCDAHVGFCRKVFAGVAAFAGPDPEMCPTVDPGGIESGCVLYPRECDPPSCACLLRTNGDCFCNESERSPGAFEVTCPLP